MTSLARSAMTSAATAAATTRPQPSVSYYDAIGQLAVFDAIDVADEQPLPRQSAQSNHPPNKFNTTSSSSPNNNNSTTTMPKAPKQTPSEVDNQQRTDSKDRSVVDSSSKSPSIDEYDDTLTLEQVAALQQANEESDFSYPPDAPDGYNDPSTDLNHLYLSHPDPEALNRNASLSANTSSQPENASTAYQNLVYGNFKQPLGNTGTPLPGYDFTGGVSSPANASPVVAAASSTTGGSASSSIAATAANTSNSSISSPVTASSNSPVSRAVPQSYHHPQSTPLSSAGGTNSASSSPMVAAPSTPGSIPTVPTGDASGHHQRSPSLSSSRPPPATRQSTNTSSQYKSEDCPICHRNFKGPKASTHKQQHIRRLHPAHYIPKRGGKKRASDSESGGPKPDMNTTLLTSLAQHATNPYP